MDVLVRGAAASLGEQMDGDATGHLALGCTVAHGHHWASPELRALGEFGATITFAGNLQEPDEHCLWRCSLHWRATVTLRMQ